MTDRQRAQQLAWRAAAKARKLAVQREAHKKAGRTDDQIKLIEFLKADAYRRRVATRKRHEHERRSKGPG